MGTILVLAVLLLIVGLAVRSLVKDHKAGKSITCGEDCSACGGACPYLQKQEEEDDGTVYKKI